MLCVNCEWCEEKVVSEVLRKYGVCVWHKIVFLTLPRQDNSTKSRAEISCEYIRPETET